MAYHCELYNSGMRRTPHGVRGLKSSMAEKTETALTSRTPHGVRGLKSMLGIKE